MDKWIGRSLFDRICTTYYCITIAILKVTLQSLLYRWSRLEHPRFGLIIAIRAIIDMKKGSEVLVNYGMQMAEAPVWYKSLWVKYLRETKCLSDDGIKDWCSRQYSMYGRSIDLPI